MEVSRHIASDWNDFKRTWSQEDLTNLESVLKKVKANADSVPELKCQLTKKEQSWATNFAVQAFLWGCCDSNL